MLQECVYNTQNMLDSAKIYDKQFNGNDTNKTNNKNKMNIYSANNPKNRVNIKQKSHQINNC